MKISVNVIEPPMTMVHVGLGGGVQAEVVVGTSEATVDGGIDGEEGVTVIVTVASSSC